jgi:hypothetical protein
MLLRMRARPHADVRVALALQRIGGMDAPWLWRPEDTGPDADDRILEELCARLAAESEVDAHRIEVDVRDREVILEGTTRDERMTRAVMMCVIQVPGVKAVRSYLQTSPI